MKADLIKSNIPIVESVGIEEIQSKNKLTGGDTITSSKGEKYLLGNFLGKKYVGGLKSKSISRQFQTPILEIKPNKQFVIGQSSISVGQLKTVPFSKPTAKPKVSNLLITSKSTPTLDTNVGKINFFESIGLVSGKNNKPITTHGFSKVLKKIPEQDLTIAQAFSYSKKPTGINKDLIFIKGLENPKVKLLDMFGSGTTGQKVKPTTKTSMVETQTQKPNTVTIEFQKQIKKIASEEPTDFNGLGGLSLTNTNTKTSQDTSMKLIQAISTNQRQRIMFKPITLTNTNTKTKQVSKQKLTQKYKTITTNKIGYKQITIPASKLKLVSLQTPVLKQRPKLRIKTSQKTIPKIILKEKEIPNFIGGMFGFNSNTPKSSYASVTSYKVLIKRYGKWVQVGSGLTRQQAIRLGSDKIKSGLGATFKIVKQSKKVKNKGSNLINGGVGLSKGFRDYKIVKGKKIKLDNTWIQLKPTRLSSKGERREMFGVKRKVESKKRIDDFFITKRKGALAKIKRENKTPKKRYSFSLFKHKKKNKKLKRWSL